MLQKPEKSGQTNIPHDGINNRSKRGECKWTKRVHAKRRGEGTYGPICSISLCIISHFHLSWGSMRGGLWGQNQKSTPLRQTEIQDGLHVDGDLVCKPGPCLRTESERISQLSKFRCLSSPRYSHIQWRGTTNANYLSYYPRAKLEGFVWRGVAMATLQILANTLPIIFRSVMKSPVSNVKHFP